MGMRDVRGEVPIDSWWVCYVCSEHFEWQQELREHWEETGCYIICHYCAEGFEDGGGECTACDAYLCPDCFSNSITDSGCPICQ